jgi:hypothetical protein
VLVGQTPPLGELRLGHVDSDDSSLRPGRAGGDEAVGAGAAAEVKHSFARRDRSEVEKVADAGERLDRGGRDRVEVVGRIAEPFGEWATGLEVELVLGLKRDLLVHVLYALLQLGRVELACRDAHATFSLFASLHSGQPASSRRAARPASRRRRTASCA